MSGVLTLLASENRKEQRPYDALIHMIDHDSMLRNVLKMLAKNVKGYRNDRKFGRQPSMPPSVRPRLCSLLDLLLYMRLRVDRKMDLDRSPRNL